MKGAPLDEVHVKQLCLEVAPEPHRLGYLYMATMRLLHQIFSRRFAAWGLTPPQFGTLILLASLHKASLKDVARHAIGDAPTLCRIVDRLERQGLVRRDMAEGDRRLRAIELTPEGSDTARKTSEAYAQVEERLLEGISEEERQLLRQLMLRVLRNAIALVKEDQRQP